jgi:hypothetical protein
MAKRKTRVAILEEMEKLKKQLSQTEELEERRIGKLANKAGLLDIDISDEQFLAAFQEVKARFQVSKKSSPAQAVPTPVVAAAAAAGADA